MIESYIREKRKQKELLLMTHIVLGYPSYDDSMRLVETMVNSGVDLMELQIPFSEPMADGPIILKANADSLSSGATLEKSLIIAEKIVNHFDIPFLFMTYYNILFKYGVDAFVTKMHSIGIQGAIIPDLPPEEGQHYIKEMKAHTLSPIHIFTPNSTTERLHYINQHSSGFIYGVARKGVTGKTTHFSDDQTALLKRYRQATQLPLALGFGVKSKTDIDFIRGKADIAVVGSESIKIMTEQGIDAVGCFIRQLGV